MTNTFKTLIAVGALALTLATPFVAPVTGFAASAAVSVDITQAQFHYQKIDGINIAYREAGDPNKPTVLLLHGFPTSSHMFRNLIPQLAKSYHVIAPDYPGFGASDMPQAKDFEYSFANIADMMTTLIDRKGVDKYSVYLMDYGAPIGYRMYAKSPSRVSGFILQGQNGLYPEYGILDFSYRVCKDARRLRGRLGRFYPT